MAAADEEGKPSVEILLEILKFISLIYGFARDKGIVAIRFFNSRTGNGTSQREMSERFSAKLDFRGTARIHVGTELKKKIIDEFVSTERT